MKSMLNHRCRVIDKVRLGKSQIFKWTFVQVEIRKALYVSADGGAVNQESLAQRGSWQSDGG